MEAGQDWRGDSVRAWAGGEGRGEGGIGRAQAQDGLKTNCARAHGPQLHILQPTPPHANPVPKSTGAVDVSPVHPQRLDYNSVPNTTPSGHT
jgi:hypothetical protein